MIKNPDVFLFGLRIQEPITTLTDIFVSLICFYAFTQTRKKLPVGKLRNYLSYYFLLMGFSTLFGGVCGHAFQYVLGTDGKLPGWLISTIAILLFELATIQLAKSFLSEQITKVLSWLAIVEFIVLFSLILISKDLKFVQFHATFGILIVSTSLHFVMTIKKLNPGSKFILAGVGLLALTALVFNQQLAISHWFNHMDIAHVLMGFTILFFLKGVLRFGNAYYKASERIPAAKALI